MAHRWRWTDRRVWIALSLLYLALYASLFQVYDGGTFIDPFNNYIYVSSVLFDRDLDFANDIVDANTFDRQRLLELSRISPTGYIENNWAPGSALLWTPVLVPTHMVLQGLARVMGTQPPVRFAFSYMAAISVATLIYGYIALWFFYRLARLLYHPAAAGIAAALALAATPLPFHLFRCPASSHGLSAFTIAWWFWLVLSRYGHRPFGRALWLGLAAGLALIVRWQNAVFVLAGLAMLSRRFSTLGRRSNQRVAILGLALLGFFSIAGIQLTIWKITYGAWIVSPYGSGYMLWGKAVPLAHLFSGKNGLIYWHPVFLVALVGLVMLARRRPVWALAALGALALHLYICSAVDDWHGEWGIGNRRWCAPLALVALGLGEVFSGLRRSLIRPVLGLLLAALMLANWAFMLWGYRGSSGVFSPLNLAGWAALWKFGSIYLINTLHHPLLAFCDNTFFLPRIALGHEVGLAGAGVIVGLTPVVVLLLGRHLRIFRRAPFALGIAIAALSFALQAFLGWGLTPLPKDVVALGRLAQEIEKDPTRSRRLKDLERMRDKTQEPAIRWRLMGLIYKLAQKTPALIANSQESQILASESTGRLHPRGEHADKFRLRGFLETRRWRPEAAKTARIDSQLLKAYWPHSWDRLLMLALFRRLNAEQEGEALTEFFKRTRRDPVLWLGCRRTWAAATGDWTEALRAAKRLLALNPLDPDTLNQAERTLRRAGGRQPAEQIALRLGRLIVWEQKRMAAMETSPLYPRAQLATRRAFYARLRAEIERQKQAIIEGRSSF